MIVTTAEAGEVEVSESSLAEENITLGELYVGRRNTGWHLAEFGFRRYGCIFAKDFSIYPYNESECRKVIFNNERKDDA